MLTVQQLSKSYGIVPIFKNVSFNLNAGERLGLVGSNGCGKTTLLRILAGVEKADSGSFHFSPPDLRVGYLPQGMVPELGETISGFLERAHGNFSALTQRLEQLALELAREPGRKALQREYDSTLNRLELASEDSGREAETLAALGLDQFSPDTPVAHLSGGQKTRLALASVLLARPRLLLLDEPTNHLDLEMLEWLEGWLANYTGAALVVSHDRAFLDGLMNGILEMDPQTQTLHAYAGNYSDYLEQKLAEKEKQWQAYSDQQDEIARLQSAARQVRGQARFRKGGKADTNDKFAKGFFADRSLEKIRLAKTLEKRIERLTGEDKVDKPQQSWQMKLEFGAALTSGRDVLRLEDLSVGYGGEALLSGINLHVRAGARIVLVGPNGKGKTTLLRTIAAIIPPIFGQVRLGANVQIGYMTQEQESLDPNLNVLATILNAAPRSETEARTFLHQFLFSGDDVFLPVGSLSYGERSRLLLADLVARGSNLLLLDEPVNHLDIPSRARFEKALAAFAGTAIAVVHDRYFIAGFANEIWEARQREVVKVDAVSRLSVLLGSEA